MKGWFRVRRGLDLFKFIALVLLVALPGFAQTVEESSSAITTDASPATSTPSTTAAPTTQSTITKERASTLDMPLSTDKPWTLHVSAGVGQTFMDYDDEIMSAGLALTYQLPNSTILNSSIGYATTTTLEAADPSAYGLTDLTTAWIVPNLFTVPLRTDYTVNIDVTTSLALPTSEKSQLTGQRFALTAVADAKFSLIQNSLFIAGLGIRGANHEFDTANAFGTEQNSPFGFITKAGLKVPAFGDKLLVNTGYQVHTFFDYYNRRDQVQAYVFSTQWMLSPNTALSGGYRWQDKILSNNEVFDASTSEVSMSLEVGI